MAVACTLEQSGEKWAVTPMHYLLVRGILVVRWRAVGEWWNASRLET